MGTVYTFHFINCLGSRAVVETRISNFKGNKRNNWNSLDKIEKDCILDEYENLFKNLPVYSDPCTEPSVKCEHFCKNMALMQKHAKDSAILQLLHYISSPAKFSYSSTWTVPFCLNGAEVNKFNQLQINKPNFNDGSNQTYYGYEFCKSVEQRITDVGICTTYHDVQNMFPPKGTFETFDTGITLILDAFSYFYWAIEKRHLRDPYEKV